MVVQIVSDAATVQSTIGGLVLDLTYPLGLQLTFDVVGVEHSLVCRALLVLTEPSSSDDIASSAL